MTNSGTPVPRRLTRLGRLWAQSFAFRLAVATSALILTACAVLSVILVQRDLQAMHRSLMERAHTINELLVRESELSVLSGNRLALEQLAAVALEQPDVRYCRFFAADGELLAAVGSSPATPPSPPVESASPIEITPALWEFQQPIYTTPLRARNEELTFPDSDGGLRPVAARAQRIGTVAIGIALEPLFEMRRRAYTTTSLIALLVSLFASASALVLARTFTRPLQELAGAANTVARGDLNVTVPVQSEDEVAAVARSFNAMVASLAENREKLEDYSRTLEARSRRLELVNRQLEQASRLRSEFLAQVSHELRTPLHVIIGYAQMLTEGAAGDINGEQRDLLEAIERYSKLQLDLVTNVLDFSRLSSGKVTFKIERFALGSLLAEILRMQQGTLQRPDLRTTLEVAADVPEMDTDRVKLQEIVRNLVDNAFKFTPNGTVSVRARPAEELGWVTIEVGDTGAGIPAEHFEAVFTEFMQLGDSSTRTTHGVGLGLSIVKQLATTLGGRVSVTSDPGKGSTFRVEIPCRLPDELRGNRGFN